MSTKKKLLEAAAGNAGGDPVYVDDVFSTYLYEGNGGSQQIVNGIDLAGEGGLVWTKWRSGYYTSRDHNLWDTERGTTGYLNTNNNAAQKTSYTNAITYNSNGFTLNNQQPSNMSFGGETFASWTFRKQPGFFDIVTYTGNGGSNRAISHNLDSKPGLVIIKATGMSAGWMVGAGFTSTQYYRLALETSGAASGGGLANYNNYLSAEPTTTTFSVGNEGLGNANGQTYVAYLFANNDQRFGEDSDESIIKCGSYTEQTGDNVVDLGWEPQFLLVKKSSSTGNWWMIDTMRGFSADGVDSLLRADTSDAELEASGNWELTPTGFANYEASGSGAEWIYMAIRRPNKPASEFAATDLFDTVPGSEGGAATAAPAFRPGFVTDLAINTSGSAGSSYIQFNMASRLTQGRFLRPETGAEVSSSSFIFDYQDGYNSGYGFNTDAYAWMWRRAPGFFDVVTYTGTGSATTVNHNLGVVPELMIIKGRDISQHWAVYNGDLPGSGKFLSLNNNWDGNSTNSSFWNGTTPTASVFTVGASNNYVNGSGTNYIAYLFASVPGISKVGSYTGTGNDIDVDCGFTNGARFVLVKRTSGSGSWYVWDSERGIVAGNDPYLRLDKSGQSDAGQVTTNDYIDPLSSGFTITSSASNELNSNGDTYIFYAIA